MPIIPFHLLHKVKPPLSDSEQEEQTIKIMAANGLLSEKDKVRMLTTLKKQIGGAHYKNNPIQPVVYSHANKLGFMEANVVKYVTRHKDKGQADDIRKAIHYCELILELEYGENDCCQTKAIVHLPECGTAYRGCAPNCPKHLAELAEETGSV